MNMYWSNVPKYLLSIAFAGITSAAGANAQELKFSHFTGPEHVMHAEVFEPWTEELQARSNGDLSVRIFPSMQLGGTPPGLIDQVRSGIADMGWGVAGYTASQFPRYMMLELPGLTESPMHLSQVAYEMYDEHLAEDFEGLRPLALWSNDSAILLTRTDPVRTLEDLKGLKIRTASAGQSQLIEALGGVPVSMPTSQLYTSMERGVIDGTMIGLSGVNDFRLDEVGRYITINAPLGRSPFFAVMDADSYDELSPEHQQIIDETTGLELSLKAGEAYQALADATLERLSSSADHEIIELSDEENQRWREAAASVYEDWEAQAREAGLDPAKMLEVARSVQP